MKKRRDERERYIVETKGEKKEVVVGGGQERIEKGRNRDGS